MYFSFYAFLLLLNLSQYAYSDKGISESSNQQFHPSFRSLKDRYVFEDYPAIKGKGSIFDYFGTYPQTQSYNPLFGMPPAPPMPFLPPYEDEDIIPSDEPPNLPRPSSPEYIKREYVVTAKAELICPDDFTLSGSDCYRIDQKPSQLGCREGWNFENGVCKGVDLAPSTLICENGYELSKDQKCVKTIYAPHQIYCPESFILGKHNCFKHVFSQISWTCPKGFHEDGYNMCVKENIVEATKGCAEEFELVGDYCRIEKEEVPYLYCKEDFIEANGICEKNVKINPEMKCPVGFTQTDNVCKKVKSQSGTLICERGELKGNNCVERFNSPVLLGCPNGYEHTSQNICTLIETKSPDILCPKWSKFDSSSNTCVEKKGIKSSVTYQCPYGFSLTSNNLCTKTIEQNAIPQCPDNQLLDKHTHVCFNEKMSTPILKCPDGFVMNDLTMKCETYDTEPIQLVCPSGYNFNHNLNLCNMTITEAMTIECPSSFTLSNDDSKCLQSQAFQSMPSCPLGYILEYQRGSKIFKNKNSLAVCKGFIEADPIASCPSEFDLNDSKTQCLSTQVASPSIKCPTNFTDNEDSYKCSQRVYSQVHTMCPQNYQLISDQCVKMLEEKPVVMCPVGYTFTNEACIKQLHTKPSPLCPFDYTYDNIVGECYNLQIKYSFDNIASPEDIPQEALLSLDEEATTTTTTTTPPPEILPTDEATLPDILPPSTVQIVQQPVPIPSPVVYLPSQAPTYPPPPPPPPMMYPFQFTPNKKFSKK